MNESTKNVVKDFKSVGIARSAYRVRMTYCKSGGIKSPDGVDISIHDDEAFESDTVCIALADLGYKIRRYWKKGTFRFSTIIQSRMGHEFTWEHTDGTSRSFYVGLMGRVVDASLEREVDDVQGYESQVQHEAMERKSNSFNRHLLHAAEEFIADPSGYNTDRLTNATARARACEQALRDLHNGTLYIKL